MSIESIIPLYVGGVPGGTELIVILLIAILLFGANKIPKLARSTGQALGEFQRGREEVEQELEELREAPEEAVSSGGTGGSDSDADPDREPERTEES